MQKAGKPGTGDMGYETLKYKCAHKGTIFLLTSLPGLVVTDSEACHA